METKYYTPDISEFHVGFEYERMNGTDWEKAELTNVDCWGTTARGYENEFEEIDSLIIPVRVKCLDKEDIESFGFEHDQTTKDGSYFYSGTLITENQWCINLKDFTIDIYDINSKSDFRFNGLVKNKSELKQILKMIGLKRLSNIEIRKIKSDINGK